MSGRRKRECRGSGHGFKEAALAARGSSWQGSREVSGRTRAVTPLFSLTAPACLEMAPRNASAPSRPSANLLLLRQLPLPPPASSWPRAGAGGVGTASGSGAAPCREGLGSPGAAGKDAAGAGISGELAVLAVLLVPCSPPGCDSRARLWHGKEKPELGHSIRLEGLERTSSA